MGVKVTEVLDAGFVFDRGTRGFLWVSDDAIELSDSWLSVVSELPIVLLIKVEKLFPGACRIFLGCFTSSSGHKVSIQAM